MHEDPFGKFVPGKIVWIDNVIGNIINLSLWLEQKNLKN